MHIFWLWTLVTLQHWRLNSQHFSNSTRKHSALCTTSAFWLVGHNEEQEIIRKSSRAAIILVTRLDVMTYSHPADASTEDRFQLSFNIHLQTPSPPGGWVCRGLTAKVNSDYYPPALSAGQGGGSA